MKMIAHFMHNTIIEKKLIDFLRKNLKDQKHTFIFTGPLQQFNQIEEAADIINLFGKKMKKIECFSFFCDIFKYFKNNQKIILHGIWDYRVVLFLFLNPWALKKCFWVIWGGDLYSYKTRKKSSILKRIYYKIEDYVKKNMAGYVTHVEGDYRLAKEWYGAEGKYYNCFMYLSNVYNEIPKTLSNKDGIYVQIGNSADPSNNHLEIFDKLQTYKHTNIKLFCPLSYGDKLWANKVIEYGKNIFGEKFIPITEFMKFEDYMEFIAKIDIAIFAHDRQQAVGNITSLLGMEKTVYLKKEVTTYDMLKDLGIKVGDFSELDNLNLFSQEDRQKNKEIIKRRFSEERLKEDLEKIFY